jgi:type I restriction enzyme S subunit
VNQATLSALTVPVPSVAEQAAIVGELESLDAEIARLGTTYQRKIAALDALKQSLLHQAFTGRL